MAMAEEAGIQCSDSKGQPTVCIDSRNFDVGGGTTGGGATGGGTSSPPPGGTTSFENTLGNQGFVNTLGNQGSSPVNAFNSGQVGPINPGQMQPTIQQPQPGTGINQQPQTDGQGGGGNLGNPNSSIILGYDAAGQPILGTPGTGLSSRGLLGQSPSSSLFDVLTQQAERRCAQYFEVLLNTSAPTSDTSRLDVDPETRNDGDLASIKPVPLGSLRTPIDPSYLRTGRPENCYILLDAGDNVVGTEYRASAWSMLLRPQSLETILRIVIYVVSLVVILFGIFSLGKALIAGPTEATMKTGAIRKSLFKGPEIVKDEEWLALLEASFERLAIEEVRVKKRAIASFALAIVLIGTSVAAGVTVITSPTLPSVGSIGGALQSAFPVLLLFSTGIVMVRSQANLETEVRQIRNEMTTLEYKVSGGIIVKKVKARFNEFGKQLSQEDRSATKKASDGKSSEEFDLKQAGAVASIINAAGRMTR